MAFGIMQSLVAFRDTLKTIQNKGTKSLKKSTIPLNWPKLRFTK